MGQELDAFPCPSCGETLYAHLVGIDRDGDFACPACGAASNTRDVKDPVKARKASKARRRKAPQEEGS